MHMADALLSPAVGAGFLAASGGLLAHSSRRVAKEADERKIPLMGVLGAVVFAAQMINFTIPGTGSSGHLGGGMLLAMLLGPHAAFVTMASVLIVQALLFADGGLLALGTNIWNLGFYPCLLGWWIYRRIAGRHPAPGRLGAASMVGILIALELGALSVALQTVLSGRSDLPLKEFAVLMIGIHLPIALVEGVATLGVVNFVYKVRPQLVRESLGVEGAFDEGPASNRPLLWIGLASAMFVAGVVAWFASSLPDGLEWSLHKAAGSPDSPAAASGGIEELRKLQEKTAALAGYDFPPSEAKPGGDASFATPNPPDPEPWPKVSTGRSFSGIVGSLTVLGCICIPPLALARLRNRRRRKTREEPSP